MFWPTLGAAANLESKSAPSKFRWSPISFISSPPNDTNRALHCNRVPSDQSASLYLDIHGETIQRRSHLFVGVLVHLENLAVHCIIVVVQSGLPRLCRILVIVTCAGQNSITGSAFSFTFSVFSAW